MRAPSAVCGATEICRPGCCRSAVDLKSNSADELLVRPSSSRAVERLREQPVAERASHDAVRDAERVAPDASTHMPTSYELLARVRPAIRTVSGWCSSAALGRRRPSKSSVSIRQRCLWHRSDHDAGHYAGHDRARGEPE